MPCVYHPSTSLSPSCSDSFNFHNSPLVRAVRGRSMMTGENWNGVMTDCMTQESCMKLTRAVTLPDGEVLPEGSYIDLHDDRKVCWLLR